MKTFAQKLDFRILVAGEMVQDHGEDNFYSVMGENCAVAAVFDGSGGIGSRKYPKYMDHTGAYMASRAVSGALHDWFHESMKKGSSLARGREAAAQMKEYMLRAIRVMGKYGGETSRIFGTMVKDFPTTAAIAVVRDTEDGTELQCFWAGDSRVYLLDRNGLAQLTEDDLEGKNAMSNLQSDGALTNVVSLDSSFEIHYSRPLRFREAEAYSVFAASDGCFGYVPTPMDFEDLLLGTLEESQSVNTFERKLDENIRSIAGDDYSLAWISFGYGDYPQLKEVLRARRQLLQKEYIQPMVEDSSLELQEQLWTKYRVSYERFMSSAGPAPNRPEAADRQNQSGR
jgi:hypothetical protein